MNRAVTFPFAVLAGLVPVQAFAQTPIYPNVPDAPTTLSPSTAGNQGQPPPPPPAPVRPGVVVIGPDGKVTSTDAAPAEPGGYYVPSGDAADGTYQGPAEVHAGALPELHVVRRGDTLWDLSFFYFNDPWQWPKVWSYNPQITNPHWIYPGDLVRLLPRGMFAQQPGITADPEQGSTARMVDPVPAPARRLEVGVKTTAFVEKSDLDKAITIDGSVDEKLILGNGDHVYLAYPKDRRPQVGKRYSIYQPGKPVKHAGKEYGSYVQLLGTVEVQSVQDDKRARGVLLDVNREIERGAKVGPLVTKFKNVPPVPPKVNLQAPIVAMFSHDQLIGQGEIVFVAAGKSSGVEVGNRMFVVRRGDAFPDIMSNEIGSDDRRFPARALGEVVIVEVGDKVSIGLVTLAVQEMGIGDLVMMQKPR